MQNKSIVRASVLVAAGVAVLGLGGGVASAEHSSGGDSTARVESPHQQEAQRQAEPSPAPPKIAAPVPNPNPSPAPPKIAAPVPNPNPSPAPPNTGPAPIPHPGPAPAPPNTTA